MGARPLILHVAPLSAFEGAQSFRLDINQAPQQLFTAFQPIGAQIGAFRINVDGCLVLSNRGADGRTHRAYVQAFHNGIVEAVDSTFVMGEGTAQSPYRLTSIRTESTIVGASHSYLQSLQARDAPAPYVLLVSLMGVKGIPYSFAMAAGTLFEDEAGTLDRDQFHFSELVIDDVPLDPYEYAKLLRPLLDQSRMPPVAREHHRSITTDAFGFVFDNWAPGRTNTYWPLGVLRSRPTNAPETRPYGR